MQTNDLNFILQRCAKGVHVDIACLKNEKSSSSSIYAVITRMGNCNTRESWKGMTCAVMGPSGYQNKEIMVAARCPLNTVKNDPARTGELGWKL
nr:hypothetical transcript [Hymenolepis microstoma]